MGFLKIIDLNKSYGNKTILKNIDFDCKTGEIIGIFGRNGTRKSTLLKLIFGTVKADSIQIEINSEIIKRLFHQKKSVTYHKILFCPKNGKYEK